MPTDIIERTITREYLDIDVEETGAAIVGTNRLIKLRYNNKVESTGQMTGIELVARTAEKIGTLEAVMINALDKGKNITTFRGIQLKMEEDTGGDVTIASLQGININICLKSSPTYSAAIRIESTDTYSAQYGIDMTGTYPLDPTKADLRLSRDVCIFSGAGAPSDSVTGAGYAGIGSIYIDRTNGALYVNAGTKADPTWKKVTQAS